MEDEKRWTPGALVGVTFAFVFSLLVAGALFAIIGGLIGGAIAGDRGWSVGAVIGLILAIPFAIHNARPRRDRTREEFCAHLQSLGIDAQMALRGRAEQKIYTGPRGSLGVVDIAKGSIRWVNVTIATAARGPGEDIDMPYYLVYGVPDARVGPRFSKVRVKAVVKTSHVRSGGPWWKYRPLGSLGQVIEVRWEGDDFGLGIVQHLTQEVSVRSAIADGHSWGLVSQVNPRDGPVEIRAYPDRSCWILTTKDALEPTRQEWDCYQSIASHLLGMPLSINT